MVQIGMALRLAALRWGVPKGIGAVGERRCSDLDDGDARAAQGG